MMKRFHLTCAVAALTLAPAARAQMSTPDIDAHRGVRRGKGTRATALPFDDASVDAQLPERLAATLAVDDHAVELRQQTPPKVVA